MEFVGFTFILIVILATILVVMVRIGDKKKKSTTVDQ